MRIALRLQHCSVETHSNGDKTYYNKGGWIELAHYSKRDNTLYFHSYNVLDKSKKPKHFRSAYYEIKKLHKESNPIISEYFNVSLSGDIV